MHGVRNALFLPAAAVRYLKGQTGVWRLVEGAVAFAPIRTGVRTLEGQIQVVEGLVRGDAVVVHALQELVLDQKVRVVGNLK